MGVGGPLGRVACSLVEIRYLFLLTPLLLGLLT
jgi:hypothetical protein